MYDSASRTDQELSSGLDLRMVIASHGLGSRQKPKMGDKHDEDKYLSSRVT